MARYVAFLGSINVGGNRLTMADLRVAFERSGFSNVETVVASGNVLFDHPERPTPGLEEKLGLMLVERFAIDSAVCVRSRDEVAAAIADNPFAGHGDDEREGKMVHSHFLTHQPSDAAFARLIADQSERGDEKLAAGDRVLYIDFVSSVADSKLTGAFMAKRLGCKGTARNIRSLTRILAKLDGS